MRRAIRILIAVVLTLAAFGAVMYALIYAIFRFSLGYIRSDVFYVVAGVLFVCTTFLVNVTWQAFCTRFFAKRSI
ncbi:MAG TPA: hypothetical protein VJO16_18035 [Candidatus Acidoferrum sp.]|nr:hypothetical protein [Candidatus Acidoferrum sp.]